MLPAYLLVRAVAATETASAAAVGAWLIAHAAIAWSLRVRPRLSWRDNIAFPAWALVATVTAVVFAFTPAAGALGIEPVNPSGAGVTLAAAAAGIAFAAAGRRALALPQRL